MSLNSFGCGRQTNFSFRLSSLERVFGDDFAGHTDALCILDFINACKAALEKESVNVNRD
jgi:hypothetical protein